MRPVFSFFGNSKQSLVRIEGYPCYDLCLFWEFYFCPLPPWIGEFHTSNLLHLVKNSTYRKETLELCTLRPPPTHLHRWRHFQSSLISSSLRIRGGELSPFFGCVPVAGREKKSGEWEWAGDAWRPQHWEFEWPCGSWSHLGLLVHDHVTVSIP